MNRFRYALDGVHLAATIVKLEKELQRFVGLRFDAKAKAVIKNEVLHALRQEEWLRDPCWKNEIDIDLVEGQGYKLHVLFQPKTDQAADVLREAFDILKEDK